MGFKASTVKKETETIQPLKLESFKILSLARLRHSLISTVQSDPDINRHFMKFRGQSFEKNIDDFMQMAKKGNIDSFIPKFPVRFEGNRTLSGAMHDLTSALNAQEKAERSLVEVTAGLTNGNQNQIALARAENLARVQITLKAAIVALAYATAKNKTIAQVYNDPAYVDYYATLGTKQELTQASTMQRFGINQTNLANATNKVASSLKGLKGALADKFSQAIKSIKNDFGLVSNLVPVKNDIPAGFKAALVQERIQRISKEQEEKENQKQKQDDKRRKERESRKQKTALAKKKIKKITKNA